VDEMDKWNFTYYVRDAQGNHLLSFDRNIVDNGGSSYTDLLYCKERILYGSSRLGLDYMSNKMLQIQGSTYFREYAWEFENVGPLYNLDNITAFTQSYSIDFINRNLTVVSRGRKYYELSNHLGNVLATVTDQRTSVSDLATPTEGIVYYEARVNSAQLYYPFGMVQPNGDNKDGDYRFGFNGMEKDDEVKGNGNSYDFSSRIHDPRVARFFAVDPLEKDYPYFTPYQFAGLTPIWAIELEGLEPYFTSGQAFWGEAAKLYAPIASRMKSAQKTLIKLVDDHVVFQVSGAVVVGLGAEIRVKEAALFDVGAKLNAFSIDVVSGKADLTDPTNPDSYSSTHLGDYGKSRVTQGIGITAKEKVFDKFGLEVDASHKWNTSSNTITGTSAHQNTSGVTIGYELFDGGSRKSPIPLQGNSSSLSGKAKGKASADGNACKACLDIGGKIQLILGVEANIKVGVK